MRGVRVLVAGHEQHQPCAGEARRVRRDRHDRRRGVLGDDEHPERGQVVQAQRHVGGVEPRSGRAPGVTRLGHGIRVGVLERRVDRVGPRAVARAPWREHRRRVRRVAKHRDVADPGTRQGEHQRVARRIVAGPPDDLDAGAG